MTDVQLKYEKLDPLAKKEVNDFIDFLLSKRSAKKSNEQYQENLLKVSIWSEDDALF
jgi:hypothetical protein